ncbi:MAG: prolyl oligopeptidase family serine peptidase [Candidatus Marinimicrobia bacterium]|nr:prolyl oligopeptidase family serine peptidase [Candidatus Neomarinimicrobiota bacterium]
MTFKHLKSHQFIISFLLLAFFIVSCDDTTEEEIVRGNIVSVGTNPTNISAILINIAFSDINMNDDAKAVYDVEAFTFVYKTINTQGDLVDASGAIYIPRSDSLNVTSFPLLSVHHGTTFKRDEVASVNVYNNGESLWAASNGFVVVCPDGLGLGVSDGIHPYIHSEGSAMPVIDAIRAARIFSDQQDVLLNNQLFLMGYSEGGYVTMATHKIIEEYYADEFVVTASAPQSGPYNVEQMANLVLGGSTYDNPEYFGYIFMAYSDIYELSPINEIFQSPYAEKLPHLYDGTYSGGEINDSLTTIISDLFTPQFLSDFLGDGQTELKAILAQNNVDDWVPDAPVRLFHGINDITVPYTISVSTSQKMSLSLASYVGDHGSAAIPCIEAAIIWLETFIEQ